MTTYDMSLQGLPNRLISLKMASSSPLIGYQARYNVTDSSWLQPRLLLGLWLIRISDRQDLNLRPPSPQDGALPSCRPSIDWVIGC